MYAYALTQAKAFADQISAQKAAQETVRSAKLALSFFSSHSDRTESRCTQQHVASSSIFANISL